MKIEILQVGYLETNCYILSIDGKVLIIDPGDEAERIVDLVGNREVFGIIVTHYHDDHIGALDELEIKYGAKVYDIHNIVDGENTVGCFKFLGIKTPGHKEDAICIYFPQEKIMFSGDFIFKDTVGRWDLDGGNFNEMKNSIGKIVEYPSDIIVYPGHGEKTTLGDEKVNLENIAKYF